MEPAPGATSAGQNFRLRHYLTAKGLDFIADDGGLGAILGDVTVRLHGDALRDLLISRVQSSGEDETVKAKVVAKLKSFLATRSGP